MTEVTSLWHSVSPADDKHPPLEANIHADAVAIGAGLSTAWHLAGMGGYAAGEEGINNLTPADVYFGGLQAELPEQK
jgi:hypothetical protein